MHNVTGSISSASACALSEATTGASSLLAQDGLTLPALMLVTLLQHTVVPSTAHGRAALLAFLCFQNVRLCGNIEQSRPFRHATASERRAPQCQTISIGC